MMVYTSYQSTEKVKLLIMDNLSFYININIISINIHKKRNTNLMKQKWIKPHRKPPHKIPVNLKLKWDNTVSISIGYWNEYEHKWFGMNGKVIIEEVIEYKTI